MFDLSIITCNQTYGRLPDLFKSLEKLIATKQIRDISIIANHDKNYFEENVFCSTLWEKHVSSISSILALNMRQFGSMASGRFLSLLDTVQEKYFLPRMLRDTEKSLLWKHYAALRKISDLPTLILEDDAKLDSTQINFLLDSIQLASNYKYFVDLGEMNGLTRRGLIISRNEFTYSHQNYGCTRTTLATIWTPEIAQKFVANYWPCALPADCHHQFLLMKLKIVGVWPDGQIFEHLSAPGGIYSSSIQG